MRHITMAGPIVKTAAGEESVEKGHGRNPIHAGSRFPSAPGKTGGKIQAPPIAGELPGNICDEGQQTLASSTIILTMLLNGGLLSAWKCAGEGFSGLVQEHFFAGKTGQAAKIL